MEAYAEAWRTFSWSKHLTLDLPPHKGQYISGGTLVLPIYEIGGAVRSFLMQTIPSPLRGVPERRWRIDLDVNVMYFVSDATQDLLAVVPMHGSTTTFMCSSSLCVHRVYMFTMIYRAAYLCSRCRPVSHTPLPPIGESFIRKLPNTLFRGIANTKYAVTFSA